MPALDALARAQQICAVFTQPDRPAGRGQPLHASPVKSRALQLSLPVHQPRKLQVARGAGDSSRLELDVLVVVAYGLILPPAALSAPSAGLHQHSCLAAAALARSGADSAGAARRGRNDRHHHHAHGSGARYRSHLAAREVPIGARDTAKTLHDRLAHSARNSSSTPWPSSTPAASMNCRNLPRA